jgi:hypothetical protein
MVFASFSVSPHISRGVWTQAFQPKLLKSRTDKPLESPELEALLHQLEDEGFALPTKAGYLIPWASLYNLLENPAYRTSIPIFELPSIASCAPVLESRDSLSDSTFAITVAGWHDGILRCGGALANVRDIAIFCSIIVLKCKLILAAGDAGRSRQ